MLVTEWMDGCRWPLIGAARQSERDHAGLTYLRFLFAGPARVGLLHADPHPGNYRILPPTVASASSTSAPWRGCPAACPPSDRPPAPRSPCPATPRPSREGLRDEGFIQPGSRSTPSRCSPTSALRRAGRARTFRFTRAWMQEQFKRINDPRQRTGPPALKLNLPPEYLLVHRVWLGGVGVLCQLGAEVELRAQLEEWLPGFADA